MQNNEAANEEAYDDWATDYSATFYQRPEEGIDEAKNTFGRYLKNFLPKGSVLEIGCGVGLCVAGLDQLGYDVTGMDISEKSVDQARDFLGARNIDADLVCHDLLKGGHGKEYDAVVAVGSLLAHILDPEDQALAVKRMLELTKPGGWLMISLYDFEKLMAEEPDDHVYNVMSLGNPMDNVAGGNSRISFSWRQWQGSPRERVHKRQWFTIDADDQLRCIEVANRALFHRELDDILVKLGMTTLEWIDPLQSGYHQPLCLIRKPAVTSSLDDKSINGTAKLKTKPRGRLGLHYTGNGMTLETHRRSTLILWDGDETSTDYLVRLLNETDEDIFVHHIRRTGPDATDNARWKKQSDMVDELLPKLRQEHRPFGYTCATVDLSELPWIAGDNMLNMYFMTQAGMSCNLSTRDRMLMPLIGDKGEALQKGSALARLMQRETLAIQKFIRRSEDLPKTMFWL